MAKVQFKTKEEIEADKERKGNPLEPFAPVQYVCSIWPFLGLGGGIQFDKGFYTAEEQKDQDRVERSEPYRHKQIIKLQKKKGRSPTIEESAELLALEQLRELAPKVHRGAVGTRDMV